MSEPRGGARNRLLLILQRSAPDLAADLWRVEDIRALPRDRREVLAEILGQECAAQGLNADDRLNGYGRELEDLIDALGLDGD